MPTLQDTFTQVAGQDAQVVTDQAAVVAAQKTLDDDTTADLAAHDTFTAEVVAAGPTLVRMADGTPVALIPNSDGKSFATYVLHDGTVAAPAAPAAP